MLVLYKKRKDKRKKIYVMLSVIVIRCMVRSSVPHLLCCFQGQEMFLFWDNNTNSKNTATKNVTKLSKYIYAHIYFTLDMYV